MAPKKRRPGDSPALTRILAEQERNGADYHRHSELLYLMHELSRLVSTYFDKAMAQHRLTHAQWWALMHLYRNEGITQTELAGILQMGRASAGKLLERLEAKRWIERRADPGDSRLRRVYLREEVVPIFKNMTAEGRRLFRGFLSGIPAEQEAELITGLRTIRANAERQLDGTERNGRRGAG